MPISESVAFQEGPA